VSRERIKRKKARHDVKRAAIFAVARRVFLKEGLEGASLRAIARACDYAPGALYAYYASKEEIYADIQRESLARLHQAVAKAASSRDAKRSLRGAMRAIYRFYRDNPHDLDLSLRVYQGLNPRRLPPPLSNDLYLRLGASLGIINEALMRIRPQMRKPECKMHRQTLISGMMGVLVLERYGWLAQMKGNPDKLLERHIALTVKALTA
jgi:AcrR family transcriptional regulator